MAYVTAQKTFEYEDMKMSEPFYADIELLVPDTHDVLTSDHSDSVSVCIDTGASLSSSSKKCLNIIDPYYSWNTALGNKPADADDYIYLAWELISTYSEITQLYNITIDDSIFEGIGKPVAYKFAGESAYTGSNNRSDVRYYAYDKHRYDYVITRHPRSDYENIDSYTIKNRETMTVQPIDRIDPETSCSAEAEFYHYRIAGPEGRT